MAEYKTELLNLVAQVRSAGAEENTAARIADLLEKMVNKLSDHNFDDQRQEEHIMSHDAATRYDKYGLQKLDVADIVEGVTIIREHHTYTDGSLVYDKKENIILWRVLHPHTQDPVYYSYGPTNAHGYNYGLIGTAPKAGVLIDDRKGELYLSSNEGAIKYQTSDDLGLLELIRFVPMQLAEVIDMDLEPAEPTEPYKNPVLVYNEKSGRFAARVTIGFGQGRTAYFYSLKSVPLSGEFPKQGRIYYCGNRTFVGVANGLSELYKSVVEDI